MSSRLGPSSLAEEGRHSTVNRDLPSFSQAPEITRSGILSAHKSRDQIDCGRSSSKESHVPGELPHVSDSNDETPTAAVQCTYLSILRARFSQPIDPFPCEYHHLPCPPAISDPVRIFFSFSMILATDDTSGLMTVRSLQLSQRGHAQTDVDRQHQSGEPAGQTVINHQTQFRNTSRPESSARMRTRISQAPLPTVESRMPGHFKSQPTDNNTC